MGGAEVNGVDRVKFPSSFLLPEGLSFIPSLLILFILSPLYTLYLIVVSCQF